MTKRRAVGARGLDEHMDRLTKQNFALKLELDHRRDHTVKLQEQIEAMRAQVERAEKLQEAYDELLLLNTQLVEELEKRDEAIEEAMNIICDLEDKVADMDERSSATRPSTANADSGYAGTETQEQVPASSPPDLKKADKTPRTQQCQPPHAASLATSKLLNAVNGQTPPRARREPAVLSLKKPSTHALRSVYLETTQSLRPVKSFQSLLSKRESEDEEAILSSPRLSVLSESSFPSIYSPKKPLSPGRYAWEADDDEFESSQRPGVHSRQDSIKRVSQWMDKRDEIEETPSKSNRISSPLKQQAGVDASLSPSQNLGRHAQYNSIAAAFSSGSTAANPGAPDMSQSVSYIKPFPIRTEQPDAIRQPRPTSFAGPMFGEPPLPPTPDSASTCMLRASRSSIAEERSLLDSTPAAVKGYDALEPEIRTAPRQLRSSVELSHAYHRYLKHRNGSPTLASDIGNLRANDLGDDADAHPDTVGDLNLEYDGYPDGNSIFEGTPSRFSKQARQPGPNVSFDNTTIVIAKIGQPPMQRRQSSSGATAQPRRPSLTRAETSPLMPRIVTAGTQSSADTVISPRSFHSGSSSNRTMIHDADRLRTITPESSRAESRLSSTVASPPRPRRSKSPARSLSQKTQKLFRRMSNSQRDYQSEREKSSLAPVTITPMPAHINDRPKEARRPSTSQGEDASIQHSTHPSTSSRESRRPSMQARTNTAPTGPARPLTALTTESMPVEQARRNPFRRSNSVQRDTQTPLQNGTPEQEGNGTRPALTRRRGSLRDAVSSATRRPWR